jgi:hypothetical protein
MTQYRRYLLVLLVCAVVLNAVWMALFYVQLGNPTQDSLWIIEVYQYKEELAQRATSPKVILVGGSNMLFGVDSGRLGEEWDTPVVNLAVHAGLGLPYTLERSKRVLRAGDAALLSLEWEMYQHTRRYTEVGIDFITSSDGGYFSSLPWWEKLEIIYTMHPRRLVTGLRRLPSAPQRVTGSVYGVQNIDEHGDQIRVQPSSMTKHEYDALQSIEPKVLESADLSEIFMRTMDDYLQWARSQDVCVVLLPPNRMSFEEYSGPEFAEFFERIRQYAQSRGLAYPGDPHDYIYDKAYYFNTEYHLNSIGVDLRTEQMIQDLGSDPQEWCRTG